MYNHRKRERERETDPGRWVVKVVGERLIVGMGTGGKDKRTAQIVLEGGGVVPRARVELAHAEEGVEGACSVQYVYTEGAVSQPATPSRAKASRVVRSHTDTPPPS